ncbi:MAG: nucleotidyltransferase [Candidatus Brocadia sp.]|nr:nucleotidyltransferase [Candidatus Brocadia sp.]
MSAEDIRWIQRYNHFDKALNQLTKFIEKGDLSELEKQGLIQAFEYTYELAWNTIKDYFEAQGETDIHGSRDTFRLAFRRGLIENGKTWMDMIKSRTLTTHTYNENIAEEVCSAIVNKYYPEFVAFRTRLQNFMEKN